MSYLLLASHRRAGVDFFDLFLFPTIVICAAALCTLWLFLTKKID